MSLTDSEQKYKEAVIENSKPKYTDSPLDDPKVREETEKIAESEYGKEKTDAIKQKTEEHFIKSLDYENDFSSDALDIVDFRASLNFDKYIDLLSDTKHLQNFDKFDKYLGLDGKSYHPYKKALWYLAHSLKQKTLSYKINYKTKIDNRFHILAIAPPAGGKSTTKNKIKRLVDKEECAETGGMCHPQQLIGKTEPATKRKAKREIPGLLSYKLLMHDEVQDFLNEKNDLYSAGQKLKRIAMDVYGDNEIDKKLVSNAPGEEMQCISPTRFLDFAHPKKLESPFFDTGSFRRYYIFNLVGEDCINLETLTDFKLDSAENYDNYPNIIEQEIKGCKWDTIFDQRTLDIVSHCHGVILKFLLKCKNENAFRYGMLMRYNFRAMLSKNVYILALANQEKTPSVKTTIMACRDTILFILESIKTINELANIGTTSDVWNGLGENDALALTYLLRIGAKSQETSNISIAKFWTILAHIYGCKPTQSRSHYYRLKKDGYVDSKKGKDTSKIWLTFIPKDLKLIDNGADDLEFLNKLSQDCQCKKTLLTVLKEVFSDDKTLEKAKSDGSVGILGYTYYFMCDEAYDLSFFKNIYNKDPKTLAEPTLCESEHQTPTIKEDIKTTKQSKSDRQSCSKSKSDSPKNPKGLSGLSDRDTQYFDDPITADINPCNKQEVLDYTISKPDYTLSELLGKFGPGVLALKKEGLI